MVLSGQRSNQDLDSTRWTSPTFDASHIEPEAAESASWTAVPDGAWADRRPLRGRGTSQGPRHGVQGRPRPPRRSWSARASADLEAWRLRRSRKAGVLYRSGRSLARIGDELGRNTEAVRQGLIASGVPTCRPWQGPL